MLILISVRIAGSADQGGMYISPFLLRKRLQHKFDLKQWPKTHRNTMEDSEPGKYIVKFNVGTMNAI